MANRARNVVVAMGLMTVGLPGSIPAAFGAAPEFPAMRILVINKAGVPPRDVLVRAQAETARIYAALGVKLIWAGPVSDPQSSPVRFTMMIVQNPNLGLTEGAADVMGAAPAADEGIGRLAYAFYDRVEASAQQHQIDPAKTLACVMAHELGHLLLARGSHFSGGIMSGRWGRFEMALVAASLLAFTKQQARSIRSTVIEMTAAATRQAAFTAR